MATWTRSEALLLMTSPLGQDELIPTSLTAHETISQPFRFEVEAVSQRGIINMDDLLNKDACVALQATGQPVRYFHGIVQRLTAQGVVRAAEGSRNQVYRLSLVPRLWFLGQTFDCRVFQEKSVDQILKQLFTDAGLADIRILPSGATRDYTVQYNESDLHFVSRLMEEEGWYYFFEHEQRKHTLVVANQNGAFKDIPNADLHLGGGGDDHTLLRDFKRAGRTVRGKMKFKDYDPENPDTLLQNEQPTTLRTGGSEARDAFRWPALTFGHDTVTDRAKREMEAHEASAEVFDGATRFGGMVPGGKFTLASQPASEYDGTYVVRSVSHYANDDTWLSGGGGAHYSSRFSCFPGSVTWRQPLETARPRMDGLHTALVLGPQHGKEAQIKSQDGEEIHTDKLGRVKVRFYWDHRGEATGGQSIWTRVIQPWAGKGWGAQFIPRVGTEVAIAFVDGDPDRPIVIGGLYNGRDTPIYSDSDKTKSGFRTRSTLKGGTSDFNEFTFDDKKGSELIYQQAQKDLTTYVKHDQTLKIDNCRIVTVKQDETVDIQNNQTIKVKQDHSLTVTNGNHSTDVKMGNVSLKADLGAITNEAMQSIELKVGQSSIKLDQTGVTIKGLMITIEGQVQTQVKGMMTQVNADAMLMVKGAITMIN